MFRKVLVANRGEIACRIIRSAQKLGIATVAVYSEADRNALHVRNADEAWLIGPPPAKESYLSAERILDTALRSGAEAIHPGYGFLSESADFAAQSREAGVVFIGPTSEAMRAVGAKAEAKKLAARIGVPTVPGFLGERQDAQSFLEAAKGIGFPVVIKASAGGGGRGMRIVASPEDIAPAMESARREALLAFGDDHLLMEKYLDRPRHLEVQLLADTFGDVITFPERDCSLQRRHQKLIEETPAANLSENLRRKLPEAAAQIARACGYVNAGTVEFLVKDDAFYFLEVNARLQVEHPVTEMVSGVDLVEWQFRIAAGERLPATPGVVGANGWAIEARICAEDPAQDFRPSSGVIAHLSFPEQSDDVRIETGVRIGDEVSPFYDSLLAKLIVRGETRAEAVRKLQQRLQEVELVGVASNIAFLIDVVSRSEVVAGGTDTGFVERLGRAAVVEEITDEWLLAAAIAAQFSEIRRSERESSGWSPWAAADSWRLYGTAGRDFAFRLADRILKCRICVDDAEGFSMETPEGRWDVSGKIERNKVFLRLDGVQRQFTVAPQGQDYVIVDRGRNLRLEWIDPLKPPPPETSDAKSFLSPLPARVTRIFVKGGDRVVKGAPILVLEAMKMEIPMKSPGDGVIEAVLCEEGQSVREGEQLVAMAASV
jgi:3-methylcrotonyl-CoA carboxylase alpha subunit